MSDEVSDLPGDVERRLEEFDRSWHRGDVPRIEDFLPAEPTASFDSPYRYRLLMELVMVDQEYRWAKSAVGPATCSTGKPRATEATTKLSCQPTLREYVSLYPELGPADRLPEKLIANEYRVRRLWGDPVAAEEYRQCHVRQSGRLATEFERVDKQLPRSQTSAGVHVRCPHCRASVALTGDGPISDVHCPTCGSTFNLLRDELARDESASQRTVSHFDLIEKMGRGSFGTVWKARDRELDRLVAVKIPRHGQLDDEQVEHLLREARAVAQLHHPNIVAVHEVGRDGDTLFIVTDWVRGRSLAEWMVDNRPSFAEAARLCGVIAEALDHAHQAGVVHRDLKPQNIMLDDLGQLRLMDFGLAKREAGEVTITMDGQVLGTPAYMSPEQAQGKAHQADRRSDIYSLGVILFELLTGERPFRGDARRLVEQVVRDEPPSPRKFNSHVPRDLETICVKCLQKDPRHRYGSGREMASELQRFIGGQPIEARPITAVARTWRWCRRNPIISGLAAALGVVLVAGLLGVTSQWIRAEGHAARETEAKEQTWRLLYSSDMNVALQAWDAANVGRVRGLLERHVPRPGQEDLRGFEWYYLWRLCQRRTAILVLDSASSYLAFSPDGKTLAVASHDGTVSLWDVAARRKKTTLKAHEKSVWPVAFSPDGRILATGSFDKSIKLWDVETLQLKDVFEGHTERVRSLAFSPDGKSLASGGDDYMVLLWNVATGQSRSLGNHDDFVWSVAYSPDGTTVVSGAIDNTVKLWDVATCQERPTPIPRSGRYWYWAFSVAFSPDGKTLAAPNLGQAIQLWDVATGKSRHQLTGHQGDVSSLTFSPDGRRLASGGLDNTARLWDVKTGEEKGALIGHSGHIFRVAFSPDGKWLATASADRTVRLWNLAQAGEPDTLKGHAGWVTESVFSPDGRMLASSSWDGTVKLWDLATGELVRTLTGHASRVTSVAFSPDGKSLASGSEGGTVMVWETATGILLGIPIADASAIWSVAFSPDAATLLAGDSVGNIRWCDVATGKPLQPLTGHCNVVSSLVFSPAPDRHVLASSSWDGTVKLWDAVTGRERKTLRGHTADVAAVAFSPDGTILASGGGDGTVRLWDMEGGHEPVKLRGLATWILSLAFSRNGKRLACGCGDGTVKLWDVATREERATLKGHTRSVLSVTFSPDGNTLASGSADRTVRLWRRATETAVHKALTNATVIPQSSLTARSRSAAAP